MAVPQTVPERRGTRGTDDKSAGQTVNGRSGTLAEQVDFSPPGRNVPFLFLSIERNGRSGAGTGDDCPDQQVLFSAPERSQNQPVLDGGESPRNENCPRCGAPVKDVLDGEVCAFTITIDVHGVDWPTALLAVVQGARVVYSRDSKRSGGPGTHRDYYRLTADRIRQPPRMATGWFTEHRCGIVRPPPPPPQPQLWPDVDAPPPF